MKSIFKKSIAVLLAFSLCSCSGANEITMNNDYTFSSEREVRDFTFTDIGVDRVIEIIEAFSVMDDNRVAVLKTKIGDAADRVFSIYENGKVVTEKSIPSSYHEICYNAAEDCFYTYNAENKQLHIMNSEFDYVGVLADNFGAAEIKNMDIIGNKLYLISVAIDMFISSDIEIDEKTGYMDCGEEVYCIDLTSKTVTNLNIENAICQSYSDNTLYYYTCKNGRYELCIYDTNTDTLKAVKDLSEIGYVFSFTVLGDEIVYITNEKAELKKRNLNTGFTVSESGEAFVTRNSDFEIYKNNLIYLDRITMTIRRYDKEIAKSDALSEYAGESLVIGGWSAQYLPIDTDLLASDTGIKASVYKYPYYEDDIMVKLLACDSDVDIYVFSSRNSLGRNIRRIKYYEPITDARVKTEINECFDFASDYAVNDNGDIWCLPLYADTSMTFYVPDNLSKLGIDTEELGTLDGFFNSIEKVSESGKYAFFGRTLDLGDYVMGDYNVNYSYVNYDTELFIKAFERIYSGGWLIYSYDSADHPLFNNPASTGNMKDSVNSDIAAMRYCYSYDFISSIGDANTDKWRAIASPKIDSADEKNHAIVYYVIINPYSTKKKAAEEYLGFIAEGNLKYRNRFSTMYKDKEVYDGYSNMTPELINDMYEIFENAVVWEPIMPTGYDTTYIEDYQNGKTTAKEAAQYLQRQAEMTYNE